MDFILGQGEIAVEIKGAAKIDGKDLFGIRAFTEEFSPKRSIVVCNEKDKRVRGKIELLPWEIFLHELWAGKIL